MVQVRCLNTPAGIWSTWPRWCKRVRHCCLWWVAPAGPAAPCTYRQAMTRTKRTIEATPRCQLAACWVWAPASCPGDDLHRSAVWRILRRPETNTKQYYIQTHNYHSCGKDISAWIWFRYSRNFTSIVSSLWSSHCGVEISVSEFAWLNKLHLSAWFCYPLIFLTVNTSFLQNILGNRHETSSNVKKTKFKSKAFRLESPYH